jgi:phosphonate transport system substrate-binding protein
VKTILLYFFISQLISSSLYSLTFGIVPQQSPLKLIKSWNPIVEYLEKETGQKIELKIENSIIKFEQELYAGKYDFAYMNPYHYVLSNKKQSYIAKIRADKNIVGILVVNKKSNLNNIIDLKGKNFFFPSPNSFAATLLCKYELSKNFNINIDKNESFSYVNSHDSVYKGVARGIGDVGGGIERTFNALKDKETKDSLKILYKTKAYPSHPIAFKQSMSDEIQKKLIDAFMNIPESLLKSLSIKHMTKTDNLEYDIIRDIAKELSLSKD